MTKRPDVCVSLISTNTRELLRDCLESVHAPGRRAHIETYVVDNASSDGTAAMLTERFPEVRVITNGARRGYGANHNQVFARSTARYVLVLNEDTRLEASTIDTMVAFMDRTPDAGVAGCKVVYGDGSLQRNAGRFPSIVGEFLHFGFNVTRLGKTWYYDWKFMEDWGYDRTRAVDWVSGCFFLVRRDVLQALGGFHPDIFIYFEDAEFCLRMTRRTPFRTYYCGDTTIVHYHGRSFNPEIFDRERFAFEGSCVYVRTAYGRAVERCYRTACRLLWRCSSFGVAVLHLLGGGRSPRVSRKRKFYRHLLSARGNS